jgi:hypothetical protein
MADRRGQRFLLEALFLIALATALAFARLDALEIAGLMLLGWVIVALLEWAAWRGEPHYGSGLPPRYYVPSVNLPPAQPLEQVVTTGYPEARDEAPTWIAPAALRAELLGEWPVSMHVTGESEEPAPATEDGAELELEAGTIVSLPAPIVDEDTQPEAAPLPPPEPEPEPVPEAEPVPEPEPEPSIDVVLAQSTQAVARYTLDPLAEPAQRRRFGRGGGEAVPAVEVPARPTGARPLPGRTTGQD